MNEELKDNLFYICSMLEYIARKTKNSLKTIINCMSDEDIKHELQAASVNHSLSFEQVSDEWIERYNIKKGTNDFIAKCIYNVPSYTSIGKVYQRLILDVSNKDNIVENTRKVLSSFIVPLISNYNSSLYYSTPDYLKCSYQAGKLLD